MALHLLNLKLVGQLRRSSVVRPLRTPGHWRTPRMTTRASPDPRLHQAVLLFVLALIGFRIGERRTFAQLSPFDFAVSVALGALIGRTAASHTTSFATGAVALIALLVAPYVDTSRRHTSRSARDRCAAGCGLRATCTATRGGHSLCRCPLR